MSSAVTPPSVEKRWQGRGEGAHYAAGRFRSARARDRDPRLVDRLIRTLPSAGAALGSVLDVPCGTGRLRAGVTAAGRGVTWTGVDVSHEMLAQVEPDGEHRPRALVRASADALPFPDGSFDLVLCCRLLHHLTEPSTRQAVLAELARVSRRYVIASYWDAATYQAWRRRTKGVLRRRGREETRRAVDWEVLRGELKACGLRPVRRAHSLRFVSQQAFFLAELRT